MNVGNIISLINKQILWISETNKVSPSESDTSPQKQPGSRQGRLAMLAQNINNWEDDLSHPSIQ